MQTNQLKNPQQQQQLHTKHLDPQKTAPKPNPYPITPTNGTQQKHFNGSQRYCRLVKTSTYKFELLEEAKRLNQFEEAYFEFTRRCQNETDVHEILIKDRGFYNIISKASIFAVLANTPETKKYLDYLCIASAVDQWQETLTSMNKIILDAFCCLKHSVRLKLTQLLEFIIEKNPSNLDNIIVNFFREFNAGSCIGTTEELMEFLLATLEMFVRKKDWFQAYSSNGNSLLFACMFSTLSRFLSDLPAGYDRCRQLLIHVVDFILRERFKDLIPLGRDLLLIMQRVSKFFPIHWKNLMHHPQNLLPNFEGVPQLLSTKCSNQITINKVAFRLQFCIDRILMYRPEILYQLHCEWLTNDYLSGFDACSLRSELIRFLINNPKYQTASDQIKQARNALLVFLISNTTKKVVSECQVAKLALVFDCMCTEQTKDNNGGTQAVILESFYLVLRYLMDKQPEIANSLLELVIRNTLDFVTTFQTQVYSNVSNSFRILLSTANGAVQTLIEHKNIDRNLRIALSEFLPEVYGKRVQQQANDLNTGTARIEDLAAESRQILEQASSDPRVSQNKAEKRKIRQSKSSDHEIEQMKKGLLDEEVQRESKSLDDLIPTLQGQLKEAVESFKKAMENSTTDDAIDPKDELLHLLTLIKEPSNMVDKEQCKILASCISAICSRSLNELRNTTKLKVKELLNKPIFILFECVYKARSQKLSEKKPWLIVLRQMSKTCQSIGYLYLCYLSNNLNKNNKIEASCYYEFVEIMKSSPKERLCQDMITCSIECPCLFGYLLPFVFASFSEACGSTSLIETFCNVLDEHQAYNLASQMQIRGDINIFQKSTFSDIFEASLNWNCCAQNTLWQFIRADSVSLDWIFESLPLIKEQKHPTVAFNLLNMLQFMEIDITLAIVRGLFSKYSDDNLTLNLLNLIITDTEIQQLMSQKVVSLMKTLLTKKNFYRSESPTKASEEYSNLQTVFEHFERILASVPAKKKSLVKGLLKTEPILKFYKSLKQSNEETFDELQENFSNLFSTWESAIETEGNNVKTPTKGKGRKLNDSSDREPTKTKRARIDYEESEDEEDDD